MTGRGIQSTYYSPIIATGPKEKPRKHIGRPPIITPDIVDFIAAKVAKGLPLYQALYLWEGYAYCVDEWNRQLQKRPILLARYEKARAMWTEQALDEIATCTLKTMPAKVWILERRQPGDFAIKASQTNVNVHVNTVVGLENDTLRRAASMVKRANRLQRVPFKARELGGVKQTVDLAAQDAHVTPCPAVSPVTVDKPKP